jgi:signal transduction histidine kinase
MTNHDPTEQAGTIEMPTKPRRGGLRPGVVSVITAVVALSLAATAMIFAIAEGTTGAADQGTVGVLSEASLSAAAATYNGVAQAHVIAEAGQLGMSTVEDLEKTLEQAEQAATELLHRAERLTAQLDGDSLAETIKLQTDALVLEVDTVVYLIRSRDLAGSAARIGGDLEAAYASLASQLAAERDASMARIALAGENAGRLADAARFLVVLLVPAAVLLGYRRRVRRDQQRRDLEHQLEKQQAVSQAQDEFIANLSHELRTPLTAIYGFSLELIEPGQPVPPALARELATYIASESADLSRMVEDILAAASADQGGLVISSQAVDPSVEVAMVLGPMIATGAKFRTSVEGAQITTDPLRFRQIVRNLASNALRHGGPTCSIIGRIEADEYVVEVRDDGSGIPEQLEGRLFSRFVHRGEEPLLTGSVGLGLAMAQLLTTHTGGSITYRREDGETVFAVTYPLAANEGKRREPIQDRGGAEASRLGSDLDAVIDIDSYAERAEVGLTKPETS